MHEHMLRLEHHRSDLAPVFGRSSAGSEVDVQAASNDLTEAWRELLSRLPSDLYTALQEAMPPPPTVQAFRVPMAPDQDGET